MKVILLQEIKGQGGEGDVVEVKRGYAVNYLFPQKLAIEASKGNLKQLDLRKHNIAKRESERLDSADKVHTALTDKVLTIPARVGEEGQLFGSVTTQQIADKLKEVFDLEIDRKKIDLRAPIKTAGEHSVTVSIYRDVKAVLTVNVVDENVNEEEAKVDESKEAAAPDAQADVQAEAETQGEAEVEAQAETAVDDEASEGTDEASEIAQPAEAVDEKPAEEAEAAIDETVESDAVAEADPEVAAPDEDVTNEATEAATEDESDDKE